MTTVARENLLVEGPFFNQVPASKVLVRPTGAAASSQPTSLGAMAAAAGASTYASNGMPTSGQAFKETDACTSAGVHLTATAAAGAFGVTMTAGTTLCLSSEVANGGTVTDTATWEAILPQSYIAGKDLTFKTNALTVLTTGATLTTETLVIDAYLKATGGVLGSSLIASGNTITLTATAATSSVTIPGTTLTPGAHLLLRGVMKLIESAGTNAHGIINGAGLF
jgi:hypothetical protein